MTGKEFFQRQNEEGGIEKRFAVLTPTEIEKFIKQTKKEIPNLMDLAHLDWVRRRGRMGLLTPEDKQEITRKALILFLEEYNQNES